MEGKEEVKSGEPPNLNFSHRTTRHAGMSLQPMSTSDYSVGGDQIACSAIEICRGLEQN